MVLIFSTAGDPSTLDVMRWIKHLSNAKVVRINADETYSVDLTFSEDDFHIRVDDDAFCLADVSSAWLRKGDFWFRGLFSPVVAPWSSALSSHLSQRLQREDRNLREHFHYVLQNAVRVLGSAKGRARTSWSSWSMPARSAFERRRSVSRLRVSTRSACWSPIARMSPRRCRTACISSTPARARLGTSRTRKRSRRTA